MTSETYEYALIPVGDGQAKRVPLPLHQTAAQRRAYLAKVPAEVLAVAELWPMPMSPDVADAAPVVLPDSNAPGAGGEE